VTVTVTTSTPDLTTTLASLLFTPGNFNTNQTVFVSAGPGAVPGAQSVLLKAGPLGQFKLPVTITPASNTAVFFIDPVNGNDGFPGTGTAAKPWQKVASVLDSSQPPGSQVAAVASAGNDVVVTILKSGTTPETVSNNISTPNLLAGSVTVLQAPFKKMFELDMQANQLILNKGYKLQDIKIKSSRNNGTAVEITHPTAGLASVEVECTGSNVICVKVVGPGSHTLKDVIVKVVASNTNNIAIRNNDATANLSIVGGEVQLTGGTNPITLINSQGVLTVTGLTVDMTGGAHAQASTGIVLNAAGSSVTGSTIKVNNGPSSSSPAIGIDVQHTTGTSTVALNNFIGSGTNTVGIKGGSKLSPDSSGNNFSGFGTLVQP